MYLIIRFAEIAIIVSIQSTHSTFLRVLVGLSEDYVDISTYNYRKISILTAYTKDTIPRI